MLGRVLGGGNSRMPAMEPQILCTPGTQSQLTGSCKSTQAGTLIGVPGERGPKREGRVHRDALLHRLRRVTMRSRRCIPTLPMTHVLTTRVSTKIGEAMASAERRHRLRQAFNTSSSDFGAPSAHLSMLSNAGCWAETNSRGACNEFRYFSSSDSVGSSDRAVRSSLETAWKGSVSATKAVETHRAKAVSQQQRQWKHTGQRQCLSREGSGNTQGKGSVSAAKAVETHGVKAVSQPRRQWKHTG